MYGALSGANWDNVRPVDQLASVDKPILLLHGTDDQTIPIENAYRLVESNPRIKLIEFEGGGHSNLYGLDPELYQTEMMRYLHQVFN